MSRRRLFVWLLLACLATLIRGPADAATIVVVSLDGPGEGLDDPTPVSPVGGNPGLTVGAQRLNVLQHAADIWGSILPSTITITVEAYFDALPCSPISGALGAAGPKWVWWDFPGAQYAGTMYAMALADKLAGVNIYPDGGGDIEAWFNSTIGTPGCLDGTYWYYGYDSQEGVGTELLAVALHELGHGLGFLTFADEATGALYLDMPDVYSRFMYDNTAAKHWHEMTDGERMASAVNAGGLVWDGPAVTGMAPSLLGKRPQITVNAPASIAGVYTTVAAGFGAALGNPEVTAPVVAVDDGVDTPGDACSPIINGAVVAGKIALIPRGGCRFVDKARRARDAGAVGVIFIDNVAANVPPIAGGTDATIQIPVASVTLADGTDIEGELATGVNATIGTHPTEMAGVDGAGRLRLYAPNPLAPGSGLSHWDTAVYPKMLMEPTLSGSLVGYQDMTRHLMRDLGWFTGSSITAAETPGARRASLSLRSAPNPFRDATVIEFALARAGRAELDVLDLQGRRILRLLAEDLPAGMRAVSWQGSGEDGTGAPAGLYFLRLRSGGETSITRTVRLER
jgi:hypothetical protein